MAMRLGSVTDDRSNHDALCSRVCRDREEPPLQRGAGDCAEAKGLTLASRPAEVEAKLSFAVLGDLVEPVDQGAIRDCLSVNAVRSGRPFSSGRRNVHPDARAVSLAALGVLRALAAAGSGHIAIDDVQWVDTPSSQALTFAFSRLEQEHVTIFVSRRAASGAPDPLDLSRLPSSADRLTVGPLDPITLGHVLRLRLGHHIAPPLVKRIHRASNGNPFIAVEIGRALQREGPLPNPGEPLPIPRISRGCCTTGWLC